MQGPANETAAGQLVLDTRMHLDAALVWIKRQLVADDDETKPTALVLRPHFLCVVPMPEEHIDHTNDAIERHPSLLLSPNVADCPAQAIRVIMQRANASRAN